MLVEINQFLGHVEGVFVHSYLVSFTKCGGKYIRYITKSQHLFNFFKLILSKS